MHIFDFEFAPDGRTLFACACPNGIQQWDVRTGKLLHVFKGVGKQYDVALSPDGSRLVGITALHRGSEHPIEETTGQVWDTKSGKLVRSIPNFGWPLLFSRDGDQLYTSGVGLPNDNNWELWSLTKGTVLYHSPLSLTANGAARPIALSPDRRVLATGHKDKMVRLQSVRTRLPLQTLQAGDAMILGVAFSPDSSMLVTSDWNSFLRLWHVNR